MRSRMKTSGVELELASGGAQHDGFAGSRSSSWLVGHVRTKWLYQSLKHLAIENDSLCKAIFKQITAIAMHNTLHIWMHPCHKQKVMFGGALLF